MTNTIPLIKQKINCIEYARRNNINIRKSGDRSVSPFRHNATNPSSFVVFEDFWYDHGSSTGGDVIDFSAFLKFNGDRGQAIKELSTLTGINQESHAAWKEHTQNNCNLIQRWHTQLKQEHRQYLYSRGITDETIDRLKIGYTADYSRAPDRISIPYFKNGYVVSWIAREIPPATSDKKYIKPYNTDYHEHAVWGMHTLDRDSDALYIAEGTFDTLSFDQSGYAVIATMGGYFSRNQLPLVRDICKRFKRVVLCFDNDTSGSSFAVKMAQFLFKNRISFDVIQIPPRYKDVSDYYEEKRELNSLISSKQNGLAMLARSFSAEQDTEFKTFILSAARYSDKTDIIKLINLVSDTFSPDWLKELKKQALSPPADDTIARIILKKYIIKYRDKIGFYRYTSNVWEHKSDDEIKSLINEEWGRWRTDARARSVLGLIRAETITAEPFDKKPLFGFVNGTLELDTLNFREPDPSDLLSIQMSYPYDPEARCPQWTDFITDICNQDPRRESLLQEIAGYILFPTCPLEKLFVFTGEGGNGKSVFLRVLEKVFGEQNRSAVTVDGLKSDFQCINLLDSLFNIASEIKSNLSGTEELLKQIASGEVITACHKGKPYINFNPRCKMIFATNGQLKSHDTSDGLVRRLIIMHFEKSYKEYPDPDNPLEGRLDPQLYNKLIKELPGIFNWAVQGYKLLLNTNSFTETDDNERLIKDFKEASNPVLVFIDENPIPEWIRRDDYYLEYKDWCVMFGHKPLSRLSFSREVTRALKDKLDPMDVKKIDGKSTKVFMLRRTTQETLF